MAHVKRGPMGILIILVVAALFFGFRWALNNNMIPGMKTVASAVPEDGRLRDFKADGPKTKSGATAAAVSLPSNEPSDKDMPTIRIKFWAWNGHMTINYANGGLVTTKGSLFEKYGVMVILERQDDTNQLRDELLACAQEVASGRDCTKGIHMTTLMGDQLGAQLASWNKTFRKLCPDCTIEAIGFGGRSDGEDAFLAPPTVKADPQAARGLVVAAAPREGDQNIVFFWAARNDIPINVDQKTWDPEAINFMDASSYTQAAELFNTKACQPRAEVKKGLRTGKTVQACVDSLTTWTPADVTATVGSTARGGIVRIFSTKENSSQMPNTILGIKKWNREHAQVVTNFLAAVTEAGEHLRSSNAALRKAAEIDAKVFGDKASAPEEKDPNFWYKYYLGANEFDQQGNQVALGGSLAFTLADNLKYWGINGGTDYFKDTYELFGGYMMKYYPDEVPELEPYAQVVNKTYIRAVAAMRQEAAQQQASGVVRQFEQGEEISDVSARGMWKIEFETGQATFTSASLQTLEDLRRSLSIAQNQLVEINGHTDSVGNPDFNQALSERRAQAVKTWLQSQARDAFPDNRFSAVKGYGQSQPIASNDTPNGRARNRRVEIVLGSK